MPASVGLGSRPELQTLTCRACLPVGGGCSSTGAFWLKASIHTFHLLQGSCQSSDRLQHCHCCWQQCSQGYMCCTASPCTSMLDPALHRLGSIQLGVLLMYSPAHQAQSLVACSAPLRLTLSQLLQGTSSALAVVVAMLSVCVLPTARRCRTCTVVLPGTAQQQSLPAVHQCLIALRPGSTI